MMSAVAELSSAVNQMQSTLLIASEEVVSVAVEARRRCPTVKASYPLHKRFVPDATG